MTFYERVHALCRQRGTSVTKMVMDLGRSASTATTWKNMVERPRAETEKAVAEYLGITVDELNEGVEYIDFDKIDTSGFNQPVFQHLLKKHKGSQKRAIKAYLNFEKAEAQDALSERATVFQNNGENYGMIGNAHAPVKISSGAERTLTEQEAEMLRIFSSLSLIDQSKVIVYAAELKEKGGKA